VKLARLRNTKAACFLSYMEDRSKDEHRHKNKHDHVQTHMQNMLVTLEMLSGTRGKRERKRERQSDSKTSVKVENIRMYTESCSKWEGGRGGRESNDSG
jgi:23S rRNA maturation mini-RNase III